MVKTPGRRLALSVALLIPGLAVGLVNFGAMAGTDTPFAVRISLTVICATLVAFGVYNMIVFCVERSGRKLEGDLLWYVFMGFNAVTSVARYLLKPEERSFLWFGLGFLGAMVLLWLGNVASKKGEATK